LPGWSHEIANEFLLLAGGESRALNQMQLQKLVYIAHGWCLASFGQPLTGDRPEAWEFGPVYTRLSDALARYGTQKIPALIPREISIADESKQLRAPPAKAELIRSEMDLITMVYEDYGALSAATLAVLTQREGTPWWLVYADGRGSRRDIPHRLIREQFVRFAKAHDG
jgi:uncharacterized phage-associated protein